MLSFVVFLIGASCAAAASELYNAKIIFHHNAGIDSYALLQAERVLQNRNFNRTLRTALYSHGYMDKADGDHIKLLVDAYKSTNAFNVLLFDWRELASSMYPSAVWNMAKLSEELAKFIIKSTGQGYGINNWHLVGHSLGAHLSGIVGKRVQVLSNGLLILPRISGLEPAGPGFYGLLLGSQRISKSDAVFVDIIHTDAGVLGADTDTGTVDFWPNNGRRPQPGCSFLDDIFGCSHSRAVYLWIESIKNRDRDSFAARSEASPRASLGTKIRMGIDCPTDSPPGKYILSTNAKSPYSLS